MPVALVGCESILTHRFMHLKGVYKLVHRAHLESRNPSPWASFSFHPFQAIMETVFFPIFALLIPLHSSVFLSFILFTTIFNVIGHPGYEFYPRGFATHSIFCWLITSTHHNMHHRLVHCNYGFYLNFWDRIMGTVHDRYAEEFDRVRSRPLNGTVVPIRIHASYSR